MEVSRDFACLGSGTYLQAKRGEPARWKEQALAVNCTCTTGIPQIAVPDQSMVLKQLAATMPRLPIPTAALWPPVPGDSSIISVVMIGEDIGVFP